MALPRETTIGLRKRRRHKTNSESKNRIKRGTLNLDTPFPLHKFPEKTFLTWWRATNPKTAVAHPRPRGYPMKGNALVEEALRRKIEELEKELKKNLEREEKMREELVRIKKRLIIVEDAEERLCSQLGELEAEAVDQARVYQVQIRSLTEQFSHAQKLLEAANLLHS